MIDGLVRSWVDGVDDVGLNLTGHGGECVCGVSVWGRSDSGWEAKRKGKVKQKTKGEEKELMSLTPPIAL